MSIEDISYTTQPSAESNGRYITVYAPDGSYVSRHRNMEECTESAINHAEANGLEGELVYRFVPPEKHMRIVKKAFVIPTQTTSVATSQAGVGAGVIAGTQPSVSTVDPSLPIAGIFVDPTNGSDSYDGTSATFTGGTTGPKATVSAGIAACTVGTNLYLLNNNTYAFATYDLNWNSGAASSQAAELAGCYLSGGIPYRWTEESGEPKPVVNFRMRTTNDYFTIHGLATSTASYTLRADSVWNFTLSYIDSTRSGDVTEAGVFWFYNGRNGQRWINIRNSTFTWDDGLNWALGSDYVKIDTGYRYGEIANNTFTRAHHDCLGLLGSNFWVHHNTFDNTSAAGTTGYRACSFNVERDLPDSTPPNLPDGGPPYGENLIENNTFISATTPGVENTAPIIKMQNTKTIYRFNTFDATCTTTNADVFQIQTCCSDINASHLAPLVADQRFYNNSITATGFQRWSRIRTWQTDGSAGNAENTRTECHDNWIFNNHFAGDPLTSAEALWEFQQIAPAYQVGNVISQNKIEYNTYSNSRTSAFIEVYLAGQQTLATAESNFSGYINNNTVNSSGGAGLGRDIATTVGSGTGTTMTVTDAGSFMPTITDSVNGEVYSGDVISVNGQTATVTGRNLAANTLTLSTSLTWSDGQAVNLDGYAAGYTGIPSTGFAYTPTHYVTASASGGGDGSLGSPWTLTEAMSSAVAGNVVQVGPGTYSNQGADNVPAFSISNQGTSGNPIIFFAENPATHTSNTSLRSKIRNTDPNPPPASRGPAIMMNNYTIIDGFWFDYADGGLPSTRGVVSVPYQANDIDFRRLRFDRTDLGSGDDGDNFGCIHARTSTNVTVSDCKFVGGWNGVDGFSENEACVETYGSGNFVCQHCEFDTVNTAFYIKGIEGGGTTGNTGVIRYNKIKNVAQGVILNAGPITGQGFFTAQQNLIYSTSAVNATERQVYWAGFTGQRDRFRVTNNTFVQAFDNGSDNQIFYFQDFGNASEDNGFANNIFACLDGVSSRPLVNAQDDMNEFSAGNVDYNLYYNAGGTFRFYYNSSYREGMSAWNAASGYDANGTEANPNFTDAANEDFTLTTGAALTASDVGGPVGCYITGSEEIGVRASPSY